MPEELHDEARRRIQDQVETDDRAVAVRLLKLTIEDAEDTELGDRLVELRGMERRPERHADQVVRHGIGKRDRPWTLARDAPAAAGGEAAQSANAVAQCDSRCEEVSRRQH